MNNRKSIISLKKFFKILFIPMPKIISWIKSNIKLKDIFTKSDLAELLDEFKLLIMLVIIVFFVLGLIALFCFIFNWNNIAGIALIPLCLYWIVKSITALAVATSDSDD